MKRFYVYRLLATSYLYVPIFMLFQAARGLSLFERFALGSIYCAVLIAVEVPTGVFADRFGRVRSLVAGALAMVASSVLAACAHGFAQFAVAEAIAAVSMALCSGADSAYLYDRLGPAEYPRAESIASACHLAGCALAFAGGGWIAELDLALPYVATAIVAAAAAAVACTLDEAPISHARTWTWASQIAIAIADVARNTRLAWLVGYSAVVFALLRAQVFVYQPYLEDRGLSPAHVGFLFAAVYLVAGAVAHATHRLRAAAGERVLVWGLIASLAISFVALAAAAPGPWMLALLLVQAVANGLYSPLTKPMLNQEIRASERRAAVLSVESMARRLVMGLLTPLVGLSGRGSEMLVCGAVGLAGLFALLTASGYRTRVPRQS